MDRMEDQKSWRFPFSIVLIPSKKPLICLCLRDYNMNYTDGHSVLLEEGRPT
jgi:hypothetical protein